MSIRMSLKYAAILVAASLAAAGDPIVDGGLAFPRPARTLPQVTAGP